MKFPFGLIGVANKMTASKHLQAITYVTATQIQSIIIVTAPKLVNFQLLKILIWVFVTVFYFVDFTLLQ